MHLNNKETIYNLVSLVLKLNDDEKKELEKIRKELFITDKNTYEGDYSEDLLKQYQLYVEIMDNTSSRRQTANTLFLGLNTLIITIMVIFINRADCPFFISLLWLMIVSVFGIILNSRWANIIQEYRNLNSGRFYIIHLLEERLPAKLFKAEWDYLTGNPEEQRYGKITLAEKNIPFALIILFVIILIASIIIIIFIPNIYCTMTEFFNSTLNR